MPTYLSGDQGLGLERDVGGQSGLQLVIGREHFARMELVGRHTRRRPWLRQSPSTAPSDLLGRERDQ
eukprot:3819947-Rhodomonas_salina.1